MSILKECPYCKKEVAADAIKCHYCQEWLNTKSLTFKNPYIKSALFMGLGVLLIFVLPRLLLKRHFEKLLKEPIKYSQTSKLHILNHRLVKSKKSFSVVGEIENKDNIVWDSISVLVAFNNKKNEVSNVTSTYISNLGPGKKRPFEVSFGGCSDFKYDPNEHATYTVEIESARGLEVEK